jgi:hypothetical protein
MTTTHQQDSSGDRQASLYVAFELGWEEWNWPSPALPPTHHGCVP